MLRTIARHCVLIGMIFLFAAGQSVWGSPSGLNNIPTTNVVPENILVFQTWFNFADDMQTEEYFGFKYGVPFLEGLEIGIDWKVGFPCRRRAMRKYTP